MNDDENLSGIGNPEEAEDKEEFEISRSERRQRRIIFSFVVD